jgi:hypothetical protein
MIRLIGFLVFGFAVGRFVWDNYKTAEWQVKIALALGLFGLASSLTLHPQARREGSRSARARRS